MADKAPQDMTDAELEAKVNPEAAAPESPEEPKAPAKEETPTEEVVAPAEEEPAEPEAPEPATAPSRREQLRVQDLLNKYPNLTPSTSQPAPSNAKAPNYQEMLDADPELYKKLDQVTSQYGQEQRAQGQAETLKQVNSVKWETMLNMDAPQMEQKYSVLDKDSPDFHPAVSDALSRRYLQMVGYNPETGLVERPGIRYKDFIEGEFELADEIASTKNQETVKNIAQQAAQTGLRPDGSSAKRLNLNQAPQDMSLDELYAASGLPDTRPKK